MKKRVLSFVMATLMVFSLMPVSVFATEAETPTACAVEGPWMRVGTIVCAVECARPPGGVPSVCG